MCELFYSIQLKFNSISLWSIEAIIKADSRVVYQGFWQTIQAQRKNKQIRPIKLLLTAYLLIQLHSTMIDGMILENAKGSETNIWQYGMFTMFL